MQVDWLKKNLKKFVDLTTRVSLVQNLLTTKEIPASVGAKLLDINRTSIYYKGTPVSDEELACKEIIDHLHTDNPAWGARQMSAQLKSRGYHVPYTIMLNLYNQLTYICGYDILNVSTVIRFWRRYMDYHIEKDDFEALIEVQKERVKHEVLNSYIAVRKKKKITQQQIAERTGMQRTNIVRIESGRYVPTLEVLIKLAAALDMESEIKLVERNLGDE